MRSLLFPAIMNMEQATHETLLALQSVRRFDESEYAKARLALEVADRIDTDGTSVPVSAYAKLDDLLESLRRGREPVSEGGCELCSSETTSTPS